MNDRPTEDATIEEAPESNWVPALTFLSGPNEGHNVAVQGRNFTIGRAGNNKFVINVKAASRNHAEISPKNGSYIIRDLNSKWGTILNGQKVTEAPLKFGDEIEIGGIRLNFNLVPKDKIVSPKTNWLRIILVGLLILAIGGSMTLFYFRHQVQKNLEQPAGDVLSQIMYHYDMGISYYNGESRSKAIEEMKKVIELDPDGNTRFSTSARRIIDGLEK